MLQAIIFSFSTLCSFFIFAFVFKISWQSIHKYKKYMHSKMVKCSNSTRKKECRCRGLKAQCLSSVLKVKLDSVSCVCVLITSLLYAYQCHMNTKYSVIYLIRNGFIRKTGLTETMTGPRSNPSLSW